MLAIVHFRDKDTKHQKQWGELTTSLTGVNLIMCADQNNLFVKHRDASKLPDFEHDLALAATEQKLRIRKSRTTGCMGRYPFPGRH